jgi:hypothetical protein
MESDVASLGTDDRVDENENRVRSTLGLVGLDTGRMVEAAIDMADGEFSSDLSCSTVKGLRCKFMGTASEGFSAGSGKFWLGSLMIRAVTEIESPFCKGASSGAIDPVLCTNGRGGEDRFSGVGVDCGVGSCLGGGLIVDILGRLDLI